jgi:hypothetical protein
MSYFPSEEYPKFELEIYPAGHQYSNHSSFWYRFAFHPPSIYTGGSGATADHFKIINEIPDYVSSSLNGGSYAFKNGVYKLTREVYKSWDVTRTSTVSGYREEGARRFTGTGTYTAKSNPVNSIKDTGIGTGTTGYNILQIKTMQYIEITGTGSTGGVVLYHLWSSDTDTTDSNNQNIYKWISRLELIEGKTV